MASGPTTAVLPAAAAAAPLQQAAPHVQQDPAAGIPEVVVDRRQDQYGSIYVRQYTRGRMLGKVRAVKQA